jgi:L-fucose isomerase-like protein
MVNRLKRKKPRIGFLPIGELSTDTFKESYELGRRLIQNLEVEILDFPPAWKHSEVLYYIEEFRRVGIDLLVLYVLHGMTAIQQTMAGVNIEVPILLWALPTNYSFSSCASAIGALRNRGRKVKMVLAPVGDESILSELEKCSLVAYTIAQLKKSRIGSVGGLFPNLPASYFHHDVLADKLGIDSIHIPIVEFQRFLVLSKSEKLLKDQEVRLLQKGFKVQVEAELIRKAIPFHAALEALSAEYLLDAITLECFSELIPFFGINLCWGLTENHSNFLTVCEGDVVIGANMLMLYYLTGKVPFLSDIYSLNNNILTITHRCGPASLGTNGGEIIIGEQIEKGTGDNQHRLAMCMPRLPLGEVTLTRLHGPACDQLHIVMGEVIRSAVEGRSIVDIKIQNPQDFLNQVCGNHYLLAFGDLRPKLRLLCDWLEIRINET